MIHVDRTDKDKSGPTPERSGAEPRCGNHLNGDSPGTEIVDQGLPSIASLPHARSELPSRARKATEGPISPKRIRVPKLTDPRSRHPRRATESLQRPIGTRQFLSREGVTVLVDVQTDAHRLRVHHIPANGGGSQECHSSARRRGRSNTLRARDPRPYVAHTVTKRPTDDRIRCATNRATARTHGESRKEGVLELNAVISCTTVCIRGIITARRDPTTDERSSRRR